MMFRSLSGADKATRLAARACYIPKTAHLVPGPAGCAVYAYDLAGKWYALAFRGTAGKPEWHHSFRTEAARTAHIEAFWAGITSTAAYRAKRTADRQADACTLQIGDILNTSWGYDQTNVDFFVVTRVSKARVWVRPIAAEYEASGFMAGQAWPAMPITMVGPETMHVARGASCSIHGHGASLSGGRTHYTSSYA
jgi:hypothetical protein